MATIAELYARIAELESRTGRFSIGKTDLFDLLDDMVGRQEATELNMSNLTIRKIYSSIAAMEADVADPIGDDGEKIKKGQLVTIENPGDATENGKVYRYTGDAWDFVMQMGDISTKEDKSRALIAYTQFFRMYDWTLNVAGFASSSDDTPAAVLNAVYIPTSSPETIFGQSITDHKSQYLVCRNVSNGYSVEPIRDKNINTIFSKSLTPNPLNVKNWVFGDSTIDEHGKVSIIAGTNRKIYDTFGNVNLVSGSQYYILLNISEFEQTSYSPGLNVLSYATTLKTITKSGFYIIPFTASSSYEARIQLLSNVQNSPANGELLVKFKLSFGGIVKLDSGTANWLTELNGLSLTEMMPFNSLKSLIATQTQDDLDAMLESFTLIKSAGNLIAQTYDSDIAAYGSTGSGASKVITRSSTQITIAITAANGSGFTSLFAVSRDGFQVIAANLSASKRHVLIAEGTAVCTNTKLIEINEGGKANGSGTMLAQDLTDDVETPFKVMYTTETLTSSTSAQYKYVVSYPVVGTTAMTCTMVFNTFHIFEEQEGWGVDDYLANKDLAIYIPKYASDPSTTTGYTESTQSKNIKRHAVYGDFKNPKDLVFDYDINMLINYGQSLSVGTGAANALTDDFKNTLSFPGGCNEWQYGLDITVPAQVTAFYGSGFVKLNTISGDLPPVAATLLSWLQLLSEQNNMCMDGDDYQFILSTPGLSGATIEQLSQGTDYYNRLLFSVQKAKDFSDALGKSFGVPCLFWVQGEANADYTKAAYYSLLTTLFSDLNTDIKSITGQIKDVQFITYQMSPVLGTIPYPSAEDPRTYVNSGPPFAQLDAALNVANVHLGGSMYQFKYSDIWHPVDRSVIGLQLAIVAKDIINESAAKVVFHPLGTNTITSVGSVWHLDVEFNVPNAPMRFDVSGDDWHNLNGKMTNFGFRLLNSSGVSILVSEPQIRKGNIIRFICSENPTGAKLSYATEGHYGGGNLCDSMDLLIKCKGTEYHIDNFCPSFLNYVIS